MSRVFALAIREVVERKLLFLGAALIAVITLLVPLMPLPSGYSYGEVVDLSAYAFALALAVGGGVVLGATTIGRDLSSGRIAFFFTRQLHAWEIWVGRIIGMFVTVVLGALLVMLPATLLGGGLRHLWEARADSEMPVAIVFALCLPLVAYYASVALRSRSAWLALDVVALCGALGTIWILSQPFLPYWFGSSQSLGVMLSLLTLFLALSGWVGLAKGRITPAAVHRWSAFTLWSCAAVALLTFAGWRAWVFAATPQEIDWSKSWAHEIDGNGEWIGLGSGDKTGRGGIPHQFLMSASSGAWLRVDDTESVTVSADRRVAVVAKRSWSWRPPHWTDTTMQIVDLTASKLHARDTGIVLPELSWNAPAMSADGSRLAIVDSKRVSVYSLSDEKLLAAFPVEKSNWSTMLFVDDATLQVTFTLPEETVVSRFDVNRRERISRVVFEGDRYRMAPKADRIAIRSGAREKSGVISIHQTATGAKLGEVAYTGSLFGRRFQWLDDGGFALATSEQSLRGVAGVGEPAPPDVTPVVTIHSLDGTERSRIPLPDAKRIVIAGEQKAGELIAVWSTNDDFLTPCAATPHLVAIDLASGTSRELPFKGWPKAYSWRASAERGSVSTRLFSSCDGAMVMYEVATGEARTLLGGK